ncbi:MAG: hypothetical protein HEQ39_14690 [Rhizobacter sp.]
MNAADTTPSMTPLQKLQRSRECLRAALLAPPDSHHAAPKAEPPGWQASLMSVPGANIVKDAVQRWWSQHPLRAAAMVAEEAGNALIKPTAQKHPFLLMVGALVVGAGLARRKPWRWGFKKVLLAGLLPQLISKVVSEMPVSSWMSVVSQLAPERQPRSPVKKDH